MSEVVETSSGGGPVDGGAGGGARHAPAGLALQLRGRLPCCRCGYDLGGLSILGVCPECGTPIRATLLVVVDPHARELQPVGRAGLVVAGLLAGSVGALGAVVLAWGAQLGPMVGLEGSAARWAMRASAACMVISGIGALVMVRPHARVPRGQAVAAAAGAVGTVVLGVLSLWMWMRIAPLGAGLAMAGSAPTVEATLARLAQAGLVALVILGLRPNARLLAARSLLLRSGRVDRQAMYAVAGAVGVVGLGQVVNLVAVILHGRVLEVSLSVGMILTAVGWMLVMIGLVGVVLDVVRLCPVLLEPSPSLGSLLVGGDGTGEGR